MKEKIMEAILFLAEKMQTNRYMTSIKNGFTALLPITICGAFCTLFISVVCTPNANGISLANISYFSWLENLNPMFKAANYATLNFMAIGLVALISIELGKTYNFKDNSLPLIAIACYITLCSTVFHGKTAGGQEYVVNNVLAVNFTNAQGLFMGMFASIFSTNIYIYIVKSGKLNIKLPESVPPNVAKAFDVLIPGVFIIILVSCFGMIFKFIFGYSIYEAITIWIQTPLTGVLTGLPGYLLLFFVSTVLWTLGIHGTQTLSAIYSAPLLLSLTQNMEAVLNGVKPTNILNSGFVSCFTIITGAGLTGGLLISILFFSKREDYKTIAKLSIAPGIFNINETMTFGLPVVLNPILAIPFMLAPVVSASFAYFMTVIGFAQVVCYQIPWTTPALLSAFLATGGHIGTVITQGICILLAAIIYAPFVMIANKQAQLQSK